MVAERSTMEIIPSLAGIGAGIGVEMGVVAAIASGAITAGTGGTAALIILPAIAAIGVSALLYKGISWCWQKYHEGRATDH
jgi:hypothetical protein